MPIYILKTNFCIKMSTRSSQKRRNVQHESTENVSETKSFGSECKFESPRHCNCGPSPAKSPRIENSVLEGLGASLKEEKTSEIRGVLGESQRELLKLLRPKTSETVREQVEIALESEPREFLYSNKICHSVEYTVKICSIL